MFVLVEVEFSIEKIQKFPYPSHVTPNGSEQTVHPIYVPHFLPERSSPVGFISRTPQSVRTALFPVYFLFVPGVLLWLC
jgi:hypothetical protein